MTPAAQTRLTHARVLRIAVPIVLSNATVPLLGAVDTGVVGQIGLAAPIGAVGIGAVILSSVFWIFGFLRMSTSGLAAQAKGAGDEAELRAVLLRALIVAAAVGLGVIALQGPLFALAFRLSPASVEVEAMARDYLSIRIWAAPASIGLYALTGWLIGVERTRAVLVLQLWQNLLNMGLALWFVLGLGWAVKGVATAALLAEVSGLMLGLWLARPAFHLTGLTAVRARLGNRLALRRMFSASRDILARTVLLQLAFTSFIFLSARGGDAELAANQILAQLLSITAFALDGFAFAAETLVGQAIGAKRPGDLQRAIDLAFQWGLIGAALLSGVLLLAGPAIVALMTTAPDVRTAAAQVLPWLIIAPLVGFASWIWDGVFIGALLTGAMLRAMLPSVALYALALAVLVPVWGMHGLWAALTLMNLARGFTLWQRRGQVLALAA
jgi:MATE family multidrug resistance protein